MLWCLLPLHTLMELPLELYLPDNLPLELVRHIQEYLPDPYYEALMKEFTEQIHRMKHLVFIAERTPRKEIYAVIKQYHIRIPRQHRLSKCDLIMKIRAAMLSTS